GVERRVIAPWRGAVRITGVSFDDLINRFEHDGVIEGYAAVTGIWSGDQLQATRQTTTENVPHQYPRGKPRHARPRPEAGRTWNGGSPTITWITTSATHRQRRRC